MASQILPDQTTRNLMANRVTYAVSVTPIYTHAAGEGLSTDVLATDIGKSLGGSADVTGGDYANAVLTTATKTGSGQALVTPVAGSTGLFIKNLGLDENGDATTETVTVIIAATNICVLDAGGAVFLPSPSTAPVTVTMSSGSIQVEHALLD